MARGKHAAQAARRRAESADQQIAELKATLERERAEWRSERANLKSEVQRLQNKTRKDIEDSAAEVIRSVQEDTRQQLASDREEWCNKARGVIQFLATRAVGMTKDDHFELAELLGVEKFSEWGYPSKGKAGSTREKRRLTPRKAKANEAAADQGSYTYGNAVWRSR